MSISKTKYMEIFFLYIIREFIQFMSKFPDSSIVGTWILVVLLPAGYFRKQVYGQFCIETLHESRKRKSSGFRDATQDR